MPLLTMLEQERILKEKISNQNTILRRQKHAPAGRWVATEMCKGLSATPSRRGPNSRSSRICGVARLGGLLLQTNKQTNKQASNNDNDDDDCRMTNAHGYSVLQGTVECRKVKSAFKDSVALRRRYGGTIITRLGDELEDPFKRPSQATYSVGWSKTRRRILSDCGSIQCLGSSFAVVVVVVIFSLSHTHIRGNSGQQSVECDLSLLDFFSSFFRLRRWP